MSASPIQFDPDAMRRLLNPVMAAPSQPNLAIGSNSAPAVHQLEAQAHGPAGPQMAAPSAVKLPDTGLPQVPMAGPVSVKAPRGTSAGDQAELSRLQSTGSGISQIRSPWARIP